MNQLEQFREQCASVLDEVGAQLQTDEKSNDFWAGVGATATAAEDAIRALPLPEDQTEALREENEQLKESIEIFRAAIDFAINTDEPEKFLRRWQHGDFDVLREHWPEAPEGIYPIWMRVKS